MRTYRYRTAIDMERYRQALATMIGLLEENRMRLAGVAAGLVTAQASGATPLSIEEVKVEVARSEADTEAAATALEPHVLRLLGERRRPGETAAAFALRVDSMEIQPTMKRNGLM